MKNIVAACSIKMMKFLLSVVSDSPTIIFLQSLLVLDTIIFWKLDLVNRMRQLESYE